MRLPCLVRFAIVALIAAPAAAGPKLYVFDCGWLRFDDVSAFSLTNEETPVRELFVPCYLVEHAAGRLFWDGGLPLNVVGVEGGVQQPGSTMRYERSILAQLADINVAPADVAFVAFSHMHFDHVGAANAFTGSTLLIQAAEFDAAFNHAEDYPVFDKTLYQDLAAAKRVELTGDHDVFGDGSVTIISAPGHTPGHQMLLLALENTGRLMLSGDLYHFAESRSMRRVPTFNYDKAQTLESMARIEAMLERTGATLWIEHEAALAKTLKMSPEYYD